MECSLAVKDFKRARHHAIAQVLAHFDAAFLAKYGIGFGGGTRIAMELGEYRESLDIDFICPSTSSYRAVRQVVSTSDLGSLLNSPLTLLREIRMDRYGIRTAIEHSGLSIKLEFLAFEDWNLPSAQHELFAVPVLDQSACFTTKLTAACDRGFAHPFKDVIDLMAMISRWGAAPPDAVQEAERHYGPNLMATVARVIEQVRGLDGPKQADVVTALALDPAFFESHT